MKSMVEDSRIGRVFEEKISDKLRNMLLFDQVLHEDDLRKMWGWDLCSIDHLLVYRNYLIPIQEKWCNTRRRETKHMLRFLTSIQKLRTVFPDKHLLFGIWLSRIEPFDDNKYLMKNANIHVISCYHSSMDELVEKLSSWLVQKLK
jgi:hypothetical protein